MPAAQIAARMKVYVHLTRRGRRQAVAIKCQFPWDKHAALSHDVGPRISAIFDHAEARGRPRSSRRETSRSMMERTPYTHRGQSRVD